MLTEEVNQAILHLGTEIGMLKDENDRLRQDAAQMASAIELLQKQVSLLIEDKVFEERALGVQYGYSSPDAIVREMQLRAKPLCD